MIKFECSAQDLQDLFSSANEYKVEASRLQKCLWDEQDKNHVLREENAKLKQNPPRPDYARMVADLVKAVSANERINAIKAVREITGFGLKESKDLVEANMPHWAYKQNG